MDGIKEECKRKRYDLLYMNIAEQVAKMSHATRNKVGAIVVKGDNIISFGWNGTPTGFDNCCEDGDITKPEVIHAECNALIKLARTTGNSADGTLYLTLSPCNECSKLIIQSRIKRVVFKEVYRISEPIEMLKKAGIEVVQLTTDRLQSQQGHQK